uniref:Uncharacterized protein n=1 Tax=Anguilla anguilla TaxID=7936 RepID=A0A0E9UA56_ANGAN
MLIGDVLSVPVPCITLQTSLTGKIRACTNNLTSWLR